MHFCFDITTKIFFKIVTQIKLNTNDKFNEKFYFKENTQIMIDVSTNH